jgi:hypothetical protein
VFVEDLNRDQLDELKQAYFYSDDPEIQENLSDAGIEYPHQIPDDFSCTAGQ